MSPEAEALLNSWRASPLTFVRGCLRVEPQEWQRVDVLEPIERGERFIAIRAGHGVGKTTIEAWLILWFLLFRRPCKIPVTANSQDQLRDVVWAEVAKWARHLPPFLRDRLEIHTEKIFIKADPEGAFAVARTARPEKPEALQGFHSENLLFIIEEASGIEDIIFETAGGALTGPHVMALMCGNPTRASGYFHRAFTTGRKQWHCVHVPCSRSTTATPEYAQKMADEYGEDSNVYRVRVLGEFPRSEDNAVIALHLIEAAIGREVRPTESGVVWGLDVARFGDDTTALAKRRGNVLLEPLKEWRKIDNMQVVGKIMREYDETPRDMRPQSINVDVIGVGAGVVDRMRELNMPVYGVNVGESPATDEKLYMRLRDELWWQARKWFEGRSCRIPRDDGLISELVSPLYKIESSGKIKIESKDDMKKRGLKSPNRADAFCLTFAGGDLVGRFTQTVTENDYDWYAASQPGWSSQVNNSNHGAITTWDPYNI
jgi:phage terminase large subunit